jgi:hypothetical protein
MRHNDITDIGSPGVDNMSIDFQQYIFSKFLPVMFSSDTSPGPESSCASILDPIGMNGSGEASASFTDWEHALPFNITANAAPDNFKTEYHPKAGHVTKYESFSAYGR